MNAKKFMYLLIFALLIASLSACAAKTQAPQPTDQPAKDAPMLPNPAAVFCEQNGGKSEIVTDADGSQRGDCIFPDGSKCDEWAYYRGECAPGSAATQNPVPAAGQAKVIDAAREALATKLGVDLASVSQVSIETADWPDACLGLAEADEMCATVITPGYKVVLSAGDQTYTMRTDLAGEILRLEPVK